jgi:hypothetical protein
MEVNCIMAVGHPLPARVGGGPVTRLFTYQDYGTGNTYPR